MSYLSGGKTYQPAVVDYCIANFVIKYEVVDIQKD